MYIYKVIFTIFITLMVSAALAEEPALRVDRISKAVSAVIAVQFEGGESTVIKDIIGTVLFL